MGQKRMCGPWAVCAINVAVNDRPVETTPHGDVLGFFHGMSCLCRFGVFVKGDLILWEVEAVVELKPGDLFIFVDHLISRSNETAMVHGVPLLISWRIKPGRGCRKGMGSLIR